MKTHTAKQTGPLRWNENLSMNEDSWKKAFQFKLIQCTIVTEKKSFSVLASNQMNTTYTCTVKRKVLLPKGCRFVIFFDTEVIKQFKTRNNLKFKPSIEEEVLSFFGLTEAT